MTMQICAIHDSKSGLYTQPLFFQAVAQAIRSFGDAVNDEKSDYHRHPEDYSLWHLGTYDDNTGALLPLNVPTVLVKANDVKMGARLA